ncbi:MAG: IMP dehydrogenase [bacterium]|nr:IMP dehydrogenase [bacterium]
MDIPEALSFDDVLIVPQRSSVRSRKDILLTTKLSRNIEISIPIVSANMDSVTESRLAIAIARLGGIGFIHRFLTIEQEALEVQKVKRAENVVIEDPYTLGPEATVGAAREMFIKKNITGLPIVETNGRIIGMATQRDLLFEEDNNRPLREIMTAGEKLIVAPRRTTLHEAKKILHAHRIEKLPLVDEAGILRGLITLRDLLQRERFPGASKDSRGRLRVGAAVGVKGDALERTEALLRAGADIIVVDVAHGHADHTIETVKELKSAFPEIEIMAGNVATAEAAKDLIEAGADGIKVGVGPGGMCTTRIVAGAGVPQFSAIMDCARVCHELNVPLNADGGLRSGAYLAKALAAGASTGMIGTLFAGTEEAPGLTIVKDGQKYKLSRGMASLTAAMGRALHDNRDPFDKSFSEYVPEGVETMVPYRGELRETVLEFLGGLRSGMSYVGARNIPEFWQRAKFVRMTRAGMAESVPHGKQN